MVGINARRMVTLLVHCDFALFTLKVWSLYALFLHARMSAAMESRNSQCRSRSDQWEMTADMTKLD